VLIAVLAALGCAACFAAASVAQQRATTTVPESRNLSLRLLVDLLHRPRWVAGIAASAAGLALQGVALHYGGLILVQPLILTELLFALPVAVRLRHQRMHAREWFATTAVAGGLALFLVVSSPRGGSPHPAVEVWAFMGAAAATLIGLLLLLARDPDRPARSTLLGACAGIAFGALAALLDSLTYVIAHHGFVTAFESWQLYALPVVATGGELLAQSAFQSGALAACLPAMDSLEPAVSIAIGVAAFGEQIVHTPLGVVLEVLGLAATAAGLVILDRSPLIAALHEEIRNQTGEAEEGARVMS
jgi:drug/metabolite transporter (DMT)-like permease